MFSQLKFSDWLLSCFIAHFVLKRSSLCCTSIISFSTSSPTNTSSELSINDHLKKPDYTFKFTLTPEEYGTLKQVDEVIFTSLSKVKMT